MIEITNEAMEILSHAQRFALVRVNGPTVEKVVAQKGGFDLPSGYLAIAIHYKSGVASPVYGGISREGSVST